MPDQGKTDRRRRARADGAGALARGQAALAHWAWEEARDAFIEALALAETPETLEGLGWAYYWLDEADSLFDTRDRACRAYLERHDRRGAARVAMWQAFDYTEFRGDRAIAEGLLQRAQEWLEGLDSSPEHAWLTGILAHEALLGGKDPARAGALAAEATRLAEATHTTELAVLLGALEGLIAVTQGQVEAGMRRLDTAATAALGGEVHDINVIGTVCCYLIHACERARDFDRAAQWCERLKVLTTRWRNAAMLGSCRMQYAGILVCRGDWQAAEAELVAGRDLLARARPAMARSAIPRLAELRRRQGRWDEAADLLTLVDHTPLGQLALAELAYDRGDAATAAALAERYLRRFAAQDRLERAPGLELLARARIAVDDEAGADAAVAELRRIADEVGAPLLLPSAAYAAGIVHFARGAFDEARRQLEDAADLFARGGSPFEAGRARIEVARAFEALNRTAPARAEALAARRILAKLGATRLVERADALLASLPEHQEQPAGAGRKSPLSERELDVLRLVAQGLSDKEIANRLFLSPHTVHRHISNILVKTDKPSRAAAVAWAVGQSLL